MKLNIHRLKESNDFLNYLYNNVTSAIFLVTRDVRIYNFNDPFKVLFYKSRDKILKELSGNAMGCIFHVEEEKDCGDTSNCSNCILRKNILKSFAEKKAIYKEPLIRRFYIGNRSIKKFFIFTTKYIKYSEHEMILVIIDDITELEMQKLRIERRNKKLAEMTKKVTDELADLNRELLSETIVRKELLKELHHRVGNTLEIIQSLINLEFVRDKKKKNPLSFEKTENRIQAIKLIYSNMTNNYNISRINTREYIQSLIRHLKRTNLFQNRKVKIELDIIDAYFSIETAIPISLIINEALSNSLSHAFPGKRKGIIRIVLRRDREGKYILEICDNGVGIEKNIIPENCTTLGFNMIILLAEQLKGLVKIESTNGTSIVIRFKRIGNLP